MHTSSTDPAAPHASPLWQIVRHGRDAFLTLLFQTATILRFRAGSFECLCFVARRAKKGQSSGTDTEAENALRSLGEKGPRIRLNLLEGKPGATAAVHTFGGCLIFRPHLRVPAAGGLYDAQGRFHCMPAEGAISGRRPRLASGGWSALSGRVGSRRVSVESFSSR